MPSRFAINRAARKRRLLRFYIPVVTLVCAFAGLAGYVAIFSPHAQLNVAVQAPDPSSR